MIADLVNKGLVKLKENKFMEMEEVGRAIIGYDHNNYQGYNMLGIALQMQCRFEEAILILKKATQINPKEIAGWVNIGNTYIKWGRAVDAIEYFNEASKIAPKNLQIIDSQLKLHTLLNNHSKALEYIDQALEMLPNDMRLLNAKVDALRSMNKTMEAINLLKDIMVKNPDHVPTIAKLATAYYQWLGDSGNAKIYYKLAYDKNPNDPDLLEKMCTFFQGCHYGSEAENLDTAYRLAKKIIEVAPNMNGIAGAVQSVAVTMLDYDMYDKFGNRFNDWIGANKFGRVKTLQDRLDLIKSHRQAGNIFEENAMKNPIKMKVRQRFDNKIRIGFLSSDLRNHSVGYFAWSAIRYIDRNKFDIYCYSGYPDEVDDVQKKFMQQVDSFKSYRKDSAHSIAQSIADDHLDVLFDLGGFTSLSKTEVSAYKPAPVQIAWLGYVHSLGLANTIEYIMVDPYINPVIPGLLIEKPLIMPHTWVAMDEEHFIATPTPKYIPEDRNGYLTFGSYNASYKITLEAIATWAKIMHMVPNSRFLYMRPESISTDLQSNFRSHFLSHGISPERISFLAVRDNYRNYYNSIDISLDTFPHTGGTVTCDALWMGVPVVSLVGDSFFERVSYSNNNNAGLADLCAFNLQEYCDIAVKLAEDKERRRYLLHNLRNQIKQNPLGQSRQFGKDFGDKVAFLM